MDDKRPVLICRPTWEGEPDVPSNRRNCEVCGQEVWLDPKLLIAPGPVPKIICTACAVNVAATGG